jgi:hypothetical protein
MGAGKPKRVNRDQPSIAELFEDGRAIDEALRLGVRDALLRHKQLGQRVATWQDGRVVVLEPADISVETPARTARRRPSKTGRAPHRKC